MRRSGKVEITWGQAPDELKDKLRGERGVPVISYAPNGRLVGVEKPYSVTQVASVQRMDKREVKEGGKIHPEAPILTWLPEGNTPINAEMEQATKAFNSLNRAQRSIKQLRSRIKARRQQIDFDLSIMRVQNKALGTDKHKPTVDEVKEAFAKSRVEPDFLRTQPLNAVMKALLADEYNKLGLVMPKELRDYDGKKTYEKSAAFEPAYERESDALIKDLNKTFRYFEHGDRHTDDVRIGSLTETIQRAQEDMDKFTTKLAASTDLSAEAKMRILKKLDDAVKVKQALLNSENEAFEFKKEMAKALNVELPSLATGLEPKQAKKDRLSMAGVAPSPAKPAKSTLTKEQELLKAINEAVENTPVEQMIQEINAYRDALLDAGESKAKAGKDATAYKLTSKTGVNALKKRYAAVLRKAHEDT